MRGFRADCVTCGRPVIVTDETRQPYECNGCWQIRIEREYDNEMAGWAQGHDRYGSLSGCDKKS